MTLFSPSFLPFEESFPSYWIVGALISNAIPIVSLNRGFLTVVLNFFLSMFLVFKCDEFIYGFNPCNLGNLGRVE